MNVYLLLTNTATLSDFYLLPELGGGRSNRKIGKTTIREKHKEEGCAGEDELEEKALFSRKIIARIGI